MGKLKVHELAKELNVSSKEILEISKSIGLELKSHLSSIEEKDESKLRKQLSPKSLKSSQKDKSKDIEKNNAKEDSKKMGPVIIRREVVIAEDENKIEENKPKNNGVKQDIGFVERRSNNDFNIVYRNQKAKPMTASELFGKKEPSKPVVPEVKEEEIKKQPTSIEEVKESVLVEVDVADSHLNVQPSNEKTKEKPKTVELQEIDQELENKTQVENKPMTGDKLQQQSRYGQRPDNRQQQGGYGQRTNNRPQGGYNQRPNNAFDNTKKVEKDIKEITTSETVERDVMRDAGRQFAKTKVNNKYEDTKVPKKPGIKTRGFEEEIDKGKLKDLTQENKLSHMFNEGSMLDYYDLSNTKRRRNRNRKNMQKVVPEVSKQKIFKLTEITIPETLTVKDLAESMKKTSSEVIKKLIGYGILATINNEVDFDTAYLIAGEFGITASKQVVVMEEDLLFDDSEDKKEDLVARPPIVVVMGHVDHGKTSLLDAVRSTNVIDKEAGGITQHIGAYKVKINNREITFLDTPGHEAFTSMRARGAQVTDIAILVVAADDGIMPQTIEAINHAKAAEIPIIVAINKIDKPEANVEKIKQELTEYGLVAEEWGGDTICVPISAKQRINIDGLLEMVLLVADMKELKVNPHKQAKGTIIEAKLDKSTGTVATMLVQRGTLEIGDTIVVGSVIGRIRAMTDDRGNKVKKAGPSTPVEITGLTEVPEAGDTFYEVKDEKMAKHLIERRKRTQRERNLGLDKRVTLDDLFSQIEQGQLKELNLIVKADVQGSSEALKQSLVKLANDEVKVKIVHSSVGAVTESDVILAKVAKAIIIAFNVRPDVLAKNAADKEEVDIRTYSVIYDAINDVTTAMNGMLTPKFKEVLLGTTEVRQTFKVSNVGTIAGCYVLDGKIQRNSNVRVLRDNIVVFEGKLDSLKRFKDDAKEVAAGYECGIQLENFNELVEGDKIESFVMEQIKVK